MARKPRVGSIAWEKELYQDPTFLRGILEILADQAAKGDKFAPTQIAKILAAFPELKPTVRAIQNLTTKVESLLIKALAGVDALATEAIQTEIAAMKAELLGPDSGLLDRTRVGVYVASYLGYQRAAGIAALPAPNPAVAAARDRQLEAAQRRLNVAIKNLEFHARKTRQGLTVPPGIRLFDPPPQRHPGRPRRTGVRRRI